MTPSMDAQKAQLSDRLMDLAAGGDAGMHVAPGAQIHISHPFNEGSGPDHLAAPIAALRVAFDHVTRRDQILVGGDNLPDPRFIGQRSGQLIATMGVYQGVFARPFLDIPPTHGVATLRFCEVYACDAQTGQITQAWLLWDFLDLMDQAGVSPLPRSFGAQQAWQPPQSADGVRWTTAPGAGRSTMDTVLAMHAALGKFDGVSLDSMPYSTYWTDDFLWYGPGGIGTTQGLNGFRAHHQIPFLTAFPDRAGASHYIRVGDGPYGVTGGWPSVTATHSGPWLGIGPTGRPISMRVMDFYRVASDGRIAENWVPLDVIHVALQMGVDVFERLRHITGTPRLTL
ncbi:MAG: ester cyclase [Pseudomonadota bacterium]